MIWWKNTKVQLLYTRVQCKPALFDKDSLTQPGASSYSSQWHKEILNISRKTYFSNEILRDVIREKIREWGGLEGKGEGKSL